MKFLLLFLLAIVSLTQSAPAVSNEFCQRPVNIKQAYNIGPNVYIASSSHSIFRFDLNTKNFVPGKVKLSKLFGESKFFSFFEYF